MIELSTAYLKLWLGAARQASTNELRLNAIQEYAHQVLGTTSDAAVVEVAETVLALTTLRTLEGEYSPGNVEGSRE